MMGAQFPRQRPADVSHLRIPPHSVEAEQAVLGALLLDPKAFTRIEGMLTEDDFYRRDHALIYRAIDRASQQSASWDDVTLGVWFEQQGLAEQVGGTGYIVELASTTPGTSNVRAYAEIVRDKAAMRRVIDACTEAVTQAFQAGDRKADEIVDELVGSMLGLQRTSTTAEFTLHQAVTMAYADMVDFSQSDSEIPGLTTGFRKFDEVLGGLHNSDLTVIGGRPAMGKTAMLLAMANAASEVGPVGVISGEQAARQFGGRMIAFRSGLVASKLRSGMLDPEDWNSASDAVASCVRAPMFILDRPAPSLGEVIRTARRWKREKGIRALYVDYLQRIEGPGEKTWERVSAVCRGLKTIARELDIPVVSLAQVKREVENRSDKRPGMSDLCDSSEIEKEADQILTLYRDDYYDRKSRAKGTAEVRVAKNRHGPSGFVRLAWDERTMRFGDLDPNWEEPAAEPVDHDQQAKKPRKAKSVPVDSKAKAAGGNV